MRPRFRWASRRGLRTEACLRFAGKKTVLITCANRCIGEALVKEALNRGAKRVFAGTRGALPNTDPRVTALTLDVTNASQIQRAVNEVASLDVLVNNAGIAIPDDLTDLNVVQKYLDVNLLGMVKVTQAFLPLTDTLQRGNCEQSVNDLRSRFTNPT
jgi:NAD(P)-dependent dehydrogenase (short-subunit alcohol dehydrogenase family)